MARLLFLALGLFVFTAAKYEETMKKLGSSCELQCKYDLDGLSGHSQQDNEDKSSSVQICICVDKQGKIRKTRSLSDDTNGTTHKNTSGNQMSSKQIKKDDNDTPLECPVYIKQKKEEIKRKNITQSGVEPGEVDMNLVNATFKKQDDWLVNITWEPPQKNLDALDNYLIYYTTEDTDLYCEELPKNQTFKVFRASSYVRSYPKDFHIIVATLPDRDLFTRRLQMKLFSAKEMPEIIPFSPRKRVSAEKSKFQLTSVIVGALFGVMILVLLVIIYRRRKRTPLIEEFETIRLQAKKPRNVDTYFASYLPENEKFSNEVATIAYKLGTMGYKVVFDQVDSVRMNEIGFNMWVDKQILQTKKYIVFCSPGYVRLWQSLTTSAVDSRLSHVNKEDLVRVRYEIKRISDVYSESCSTSRIVCIKMDPKMSTKLLPPWMNHNMLLWPDQKEDIIRRLNDQAAVVMHM